MTDTIEPIDYSRPVGWWCPVCGFAPMGKWTRLECDLLAYPIPIYLPLPTPEPVEVDEVETVDVVVTTGTLGQWVVWSAENDEWWPTASDWRDDPEVINRIATASANARKKREEAK